MSVSVLLCFWPPFGLSLPLSAIHSTGPLVRSHSEKKKKINAVENKKPGFYTRLKPIMSVPTIKSIFHFTCACVICILISFLKDCRQCCVNAECWWLFSFSVCAVSFVDALIDLLLMDM